VFWLRGRVIIEACWTSMLAEEDTDKTYEWLKRARIMIIDSCKKIT
jgi:hypothetical protein